MANLGVAYRLFTVRISGPPESLWFYVGLASISVDFVYMATKQLCPPKEKPTCTSQKLLIDLGDMRELLPSLAQCTPDFNQTLHPG